MARNARREGSCSTENLAAKVAAAGGEIRQSARASDAPKVWGLTMRITMFRGVSIPVLSLVCTGAQADIIWDGGQ